MTERPIRVQLRRTKGWRMPPNTVNVARPGMWGNPFKVGEDGDVVHCVAEHRKLVNGLPVSAWPKDERRANDALHAPDVSLIREQLRGKNLACWCRIGTPCHADVLLEIANR